MLRQSKWTTSTGRFNPGDIALVTDLQGYLGYPVLGRVKSVEKDSDEIPRYFIEEYRKCRREVKNKNA